MKFRVLINCKDETGLVYKISQVFYNLNLNIEKQDEFVDIKNNHFFMRTIVTGNVLKNELENKLNNVLKNAEIKVIIPQKKNIIVLATKETHVIGDILIRDYAQELNANILAVVSNHEDLKPLVSKFNIPFYSISVNKLTREAHERKIISLLGKFDFDYIVLAKYMRILTPEFVELYKNRIVNIHHSFLPAFIGANPYKQAYKRGVKIIGATAHIVNNDLDDGPIIAQDVVTVTHSDSWKSMRNRGRDIEKIVLARAMKLLFSDKVFIYKNRTIIFN